MIKRMLCLLPFLSLAVITDTEVARYQSMLHPCRGYVTHNGNVVNVMLPIESLYQGQTVYFQEKAATAVEALAVLVERSNGRVHLQGLVNKDNQDLTFDSSAVYAQVSHLSEHLLAKGTEISYAPITVHAYEKNKMYGIWKIYPEDEIFLSMTLIID